MLYSTSVSDIYLHGGNQVTESSISQREEEHEHGDSGDYSDFIVFQFHNCGAC